MTTFVIVFSRQFLPCQQGLVWQERSLHGNPPLLHIYEQLCSPNPRLPLGGNGLTKLFKLYVGFRSFNSAKFFTTKAIQNGIKVTNLKKNKYIQKEITVFSNSSPITKFISRLTIFFCNFEKCLKLFAIFRNFAKCSKLFYRYFSQFCEMLKFFCAGVYIVRPTRMCSKHPPT